MDLILESKAALRAARTTPSPENLGALRVVVEALRDAGMHVQAFGLAKILSGLGGPKVDVPTTGDVEAYLESIALPHPEPAPPTPLTPREQARVDREAKQAAARGAAEAMQRKRIARGRVDELLEGVLAEPEGVRTYLALDVHDEVASFDPQIAVEALEVAAQWAKPEQRKEIPGDVEALKLAAVARADAVIDALEDEKDPDVARRAAMKLVGLRLELHAEAAGAKADELITQRAAELAKLAIEEERTPEGLAQLMAAQAAHERAKAKHAAFKARRQAEKNSNKAKKEKE